MFCFALYPLAVAGASSAVNLKYVGKLEIIACVDERNQNIQKYPLGDNGDSIDQPIRLTVRAYNEGTSIFQRPLPTSTVSDPRCQWNRALKQLELKRGIWALGCA